MGSVQATYHELISKYRECSVLGSVSGLLHWDMQTVMPPEGGPWRGEQLAALAGIVHSRITAPRIDELLTQLESRREELDSDQQACIREIRRDQKKAVKVPQELVEEISRHSSACHEVWVKARANADFVSFAPYLEKMISLMRRQAECLGYVETPLDALIDQFEPDATSAMFTRMFEEIKAVSIPLLRKILDSPVKADRSILSRQYPADLQKQFGMEVMKRIGFDMEGGRLDISVHPFCSGMLGDVRITTRYNTHAPQQALFGIIHETGHALYEQGVDSAQLGTPLAEALSYGLHESQSRMWENLIARSLPFWKFFWPRLKETFPLQLSDVSAEQWVLAVNHVEPSLVRVEADEMTYDLHIILRFEIERDLFTGKLSVSDLPKVWNRKMEEYLGVVPPNDGKEGVLQDVHWSGGSFGYFPSYSLGNIAAAQLWYGLRRDIPNIERKIESGQVADILAWLRTHVHRPGRRYTRDELMQRATGKPLGTTDYGRYLTEKFSALYKL
jgi:carboxypeptidase Taq